MSTIKFDKINKIYENGFHAVHDFELEIKDGEFIIMVGPSGCGKSTTLRMLAGLESISSGELIINGNVVNGYKPRERGVAMVFQSYALYPTMSVYDNLAFGLRIAGLDEDEIETRVEEVSMILGIQDYLARQPKQLSGGQQQRVALGRALIQHADIFLMDEPLSNLDAIQRVNMRSEIRRIHKLVGATTVYVTHDQIEAMTMADRIVVMKDGYIQQIGTPKELYFKPQNLFVAGFIGDPQMNFIKGQVKGETFVAEDGYEFNLKGYNSEILEKASKLESVIMGFRPECCAVEDLGNKNVLKEELLVEVSEMLGDTMNIYGYVGKNSVVVRTTPFTKYVVGEPLRFDVLHEHIIFFDAERENIID